MNHCLKYSKLVSKKWFMATLTIIFVLSAEKSAVEREML
jgi:hypothetical protein